MRVNLVLFALLDIIVHDARGQDDYSTIDEAGDEINYEWAKREDSDFEYHFHPNKQIYILAEAFCGEHHAHIVSIHGESENDWLQKHRDDGESQWIGMKYGKNGWYWRDESRTSWTTWRHRNSEGGPTCSDSDKKCCGAFIDTRDESRWYSERCSIPREFICKREISPCIPSPCANDEECVVEGKGYECICHDCPSGGEVLLSSLGNNKMLLVLVIACIVIGIIVALVIVCSCVRGCLESSKIPRKKRKSKEDVSNIEKDDEDLESILCEKHKPPLPPNKPRWTPNKPKTSPSLSDSARGRSPSGDESDASDIECQKVNIELHPSPEHSFDDGRAYTRPLTKE